MRRIKQVITSVITVPIMVVVMYMSANIILAFVLEAVRVWKLYEASKDFATLHQFGLSLGSINHYQSDYQLYYILAGVIGGYGVLRTVFHIFNEMYRGRGVKKKGAAVSWGGKENEGRSEGSQEILEKILVAVTDVEPVGRGGIGQQRRRNEPKYIEPMYIEPMYQEPPEESTQYKAEEELGFRVDSTNNVIASIVEKPALKVPEGWTTDEEYYDDEEEMSFSVVDRENKIGEILKGQGNKGTKRS